MTLLSLVVAVPLGIFSAIYLTEYAKRGNKLVKVVRLTTETLQGIPSIVYGLFGYLFFLGAAAVGVLAAGGRDDAGDHDLAADHAHHGGSRAFRAGRLPRGQFRPRRGPAAHHFRIVLPTAIPGILAGVILAIGRIVGETAEHAI